MQTDVIVDNMPYLICSLLIGQYVFTLRVMLPHTDGAKNCALRFYVNSDFCQNKLGKISS